MTEKIKKEAEMITDVENYIRWIETIKQQHINKKEKVELIFRGQPVDKPLLPKIARLNLKGDIREVEKRMFDDFKRGALPFTEFRPDNDWDWLALAQHHGLPTRLLDWSSSALTALWFAVGGEPVRKENGTSEYGVVWVLSASPEDFREDMQECSPFSNKRTRIFHSSVITRRISAQSGLFTAHLINKDGYLVRLETNRSFKQKLHKCVIPPSAFAALRYQLETLGVNHSTLFPDMDGFCRHLERRYSYAGDEIKELYTFL